MPKKNEIPQKLLIDLMPKIMNTRKAYTKSYSKQWTKDNPEYYKNWKDENRVHYNLYHKEYNKKRMAILRMITRAKEVVSVNLPNIVTRQLSIDKGSILLDILNAVCRVNDVDINSIKSKSRSGELITAKREYCYLAKTLTSKTLKSIGKEINRDHSSVLHHYKKVLQWLDVPSYGLQEKFELIEKQLSM